MPSQEAMSEPTIIRRLAERIVNEICSIGGRQENMADHLQLFRDGRYQGGWCIAALKDFVEVTLLNELTRATKR